MKLKIDVKYLVVIVILVSVVGVTAASIVASNNVAYDNSNSASNVTTVKDALDELYEMANASNYYIYSFASDNFVDYSLVSTNHKIFLRKINR